MAQHYQLMGMPVSMFTAIINFIHTKFQQIYETGHAPYEKLNETVMQVEYGPYNGTDIMINRKQNEIFVGKHILLRKVPYPDDPPENSQPLYRKLTRSVRIRTDTGQKNEYVWSAWGDNSRKMTVTDIRGRNLLQEIGKAIVWTNKK
jgi:hypothetical protein